MKNQNLSVFSFWKEWRVGMTMIILSSSAAIGPLRMWGMNLTSKLGIGRAGSSNSCNLDHQIVPKVFTSGPLRYGQFPRSESDFRNKKLCHVL